METSRWVLINAFFKSEVEITAQQIDYCFESDNWLPWSFSLSHAMGDFNFCWAESRIVFAQQTIKLNLNSHWLVIFVLRLAKPLSKNNQRFRSAKVKSHLLSNNNGDQSETDKDQDERCWWSLWCRVIDWAELNFSLLAETGRQSFSWNLEICDNCFGTQYEYN